MLVFCNSARIISPVVSPGHQDPDFCYLLAHPYDSAFVHVVQDGPVPHPHPSQWENEIRESSDLGVAHNNSENIALSRT